MASEKVKICNQEGGQEDVHCIEQEDEQDEEEEDEHDAEKGKDTQG